jgi:hypothetical protein
MGFEDSYSSHEEEANEVAHQINENLDGVKLLVKNGYKNLARKEYGKIIEKAYGKVELLKNAIELNADYLFSRIEDIETSCGLLG